MASDGTVLFIFAVVAVLSAALGLWVQHKRRKALEALAQRLGLQYERRSTEDLAKRYRSLEACSEGSYPHAVNVLRGVYKGHEIRCFEYRATIKQGKHDRRITRGVAVAALPARFPQVKIVPEHIGHRLAEVVGAEDIDFESDEFSRKFWVRSDDRRFAYGLIDPRMMEWLLELGPSQWEIQDLVLCHWRDSGFRIDEIEGRLDRLVQFIDRIPQHVVSDAAARASQEGVA